MLTPRQREVAELVAEGLSNAEIAQRTRLRLRTVENYLGEIYLYYGIEAGPTGANRVKLVDTIRDDLQLQAMMGEI